MAGILHQVNEKDSQLQFLSQFLFSEDTKRAHRKSIWAYSS